MIAYYKSNVDKEETKAVEKVLNSGWLTHGKVTEKFEYMFAEICKTKYALAVNSCTSALHLALLSIGKNKYDIIYTTPYTYCATWQAIHHSDKIPIFIDIDDNFNINYKYVFQVIPVIVVHYAGKLSFINNNNIIIEDCAHRFPSELIGNIACYSFYANKLITTGEGGMLITNDKNIRDLIYELRYHGRDKYTDNYNINRLGYKYNMSDINAAIGIEQLKKMSLQKERHLEIAYLYNKYLDPEINRIVDDECHYHLYPIFTEKADQIKKALNKNKIEYSHHYKIFVGNEKNLSNAYRMSKQEISLPIYMSLKNKEIKYICEVINAAI